MKRFAMFSIDISVNARDTKLQHVLRVTTLHYKNQPGVYEAVRAIRQECERLICPKEDCFSQLYVPHLLQDISFVVNHTKARMFIDFRKTTEYVVHTSAHKIVTLNDAITHTVSYLSFWLWICYLFLYSYIRDGINEVRSFCCGKQREQLRTRVFPNNRLTFQNDRGYTRIYRSRESMKREHLTLFFLSMLCYRFPK